MDIPFTTEQFFQVITDYNITFFPVQILIVFLGIICLVLILSGKSYKDKLFGSYIGMLWLWIGIMYHLAFFTSINKAAYIFGILFILQGLVVLYETFRGDKLKFQFKGYTMDYIAYFFLIFAIIIYPILLYFLENSIYTTITLGLPCPSTIFTFGFFMMTTIKFPKYLLIIPLIWTIIGTSAAFNFGVYPDYVMLIAAVIAVIYLLRRKNKNATPQT